MDFINQCQQLLKDYLRRSNTLLAVLEEEKNALQHEQEEVVLALFKRQQQLLSECRRVDEQLDTLLNMKQSKDHWQQALHCFDNIPLSHRAELQDLWQQLILMLDLCKCQQVINRSIVHARLNSISRHREALPHSEHVLTAVLV